MAKNTTLFFFISFFLFFPFFFTFFHLFSSPFFKFFPRRSLGSAAERLVPPPELPTPPTNTRTIPLPPGNTSHPDPHNHDPRTSQHFQNSHQNPFKTPPQHPHTHFPTPHRAPSINPHHRTTTTPPIIIIHHKNTNYHFSPIFTISNHFPPLPTIYNLLPEDSNPDTHAHPPHHPHRRPSRAPLETVTPTVTSPNQPKEQHRSPHSPPNSPIPPDTAEHPHH